MKALEFGSSPPSLGIPASTGEFQGRASTDKRRAEEEESGMKLKKTGLLFLLLFHIINARGTHACNFACLNSKNERELAGTAAILKREQ